MPCTVAEKTAKNLKGGLLFCRTLYVDLLYNLLFTSWMHLICFGFLVQLIVHCTVLCESTTN